MIDDYVIAGAAAVIVASVLVMMTLLYRYRELVREADRSTRLAKDVWDSVNSRFAVVDSRIIDLMAKTEVLSSRLNIETAPSRLSEPVIETGSTTATSAGRTTSAGSQTSTSATQSTETEARVLRLLVTGPRSSAQIKDELGRSREHTARLMKGLFERGLVVRNERTKPYVYEITSAGRTYVAS